MSVSSGVGSKATQPAPSKATSTHAVTSSPVTSTVAPSSAEASPWLRRHSWVDASRIAPGWAMGVEADAANS